jgi:hypothetical protein
LLLPLLLLLLLLQVITALRDKQREIREAFQAQWDIFKKADRAWKGWFAEERKKRCVGQAAAGRLCNWVTASRHAGAHLGCG